MSARAYNGDMHWEVGREGKGIKEKLLYMVTEWNSLFYMPAESDPLFTLVWAAVNHRICGMIIKVEATADLWIQEICALLLEGSCIQVSIGWPANNQVKTVPTTD